MEGLSESCTPGHGLRLASGGHVAEGPRGRAAARAAGRCVSGGQGGSEERQ